MVRDHHTFDHVGQDSGPRAFTDPDRDHRLIASTTDRPIDADELRRRPEVRSDQSGTARGLGQDAGCIGEPGGRGHGPEYEPGVYQSSVRPMLISGTATVRGVDLTPLQQRTFDLLKRTEPLVFDPEFVDSVRTDVTEAFAGFADRLGTERVFMSKHRVASALGCEVKHLLPDDFSWSSAVAGGQVAHRAVQLLLNWRGEPVPAVLVDEAFERVVDDDPSLGPWLAGLSEADRADLRSVAVDQVVKFQESFPPLDQRSAPTVESRMRWPLDGPVILSGRADLVIGRVVAAAGPVESRKVVIDLKTGWVNQQHREDLRFYALIETLRVGVPPRKLASFYLDAGEAVVEDVTEGVMRSAVRRTLDAVDAEIALRFEGREPVKRPGRPCRWCPLADECAEGRAFLDAEADDRY